VDATSIEEESFVFYILCFPADIKKRHQRIGGSGYEYKLGR